MIDALHELRDLLDGIERDGEDFDQGAMDAAISIVETLILANEKPLPIPRIGLCYSIPTPVSPAAAAAAAAPQQPKPQKSRRPKSQQFEINSRKKRKVA